MDRIFFYGSSRAKIIKFCWSRFQSPVSWYSVGWRHEKIALQKLKGMNLSEKWRTFVFRLFWGKIEPENDNSSSSRSSSVSKKSSFTKSADIFHTKPRPYLPASLIFGACYQIRPVLLISVFKVWIILVIVASKIYLNLEKAFLKSGFRTISKLIHQQFEIPEKWT